MGKATSAQIHKAANDCKIEVFGEPGDKARVIRCVHETLREHNGPGYGGGTRASAARVDKQIWRASAAALRAARKKPGLAGSRRRRRR